MSDLIRLIPPSIGHDTAMQAAADAAGAQQDKVRNLVSQILLWSRVDELSEAVLDHLAWALHIDGWEYAGTLEKKRWLVKHFHDWHRYKGTEYGLALYWRVLLGRELYKATPPHTAYCGSSLTAAERAAFEAPHPELRIYPVPAFRGQTGAFLRRLPGRSGRRACSVWGQIRCHLAHRLQGGAVRSAKQRVHRPAQHAL